MTLKNILVAMLYNVQLLHYAGQNGIAAYGVLMYVNMIFQAAFLGYAVGSAPIVSYHYGGQNGKELRNLLKRSLWIIAVFAVAMFLSAELLAKPLARMFVGYDRELMEITLRGFVIYSFSFLFSGFAIFGSSFFTALNDGLTSALISFLLYVEDFLNGHYYSDHRDAAGKNRHRKNIGILRGILTKRKDLVELFFSNILFAPNRM